MGLSAKVVMLADSDTALTAYKSGNIEINNGIYSFDDIENLKKTDKTFKIIPDLGVYYYIFNLGDTK